MFTNKLQVWYLKVSWQLLRVWDSQVRWISKTPILNLQDPFSDNSKDSYISENCCRLHAYCLNREPVFFQNTLFLVDRFHWCGHIGCSTGYCLDSYKKIDTRGINSQVNEQANARLKRMQSQLTYMKPANFSFHVSLFLAIKNRGK